MKTSPRPAAVLLLAAAALAPAADLGHYDSDSAGFDTRTHWLDTGAEVVVFGAQFTPALASEALAAIRSATTSPVRWVVVLHPNPDKFNGAAVFQAAGAELVASASTAAAIPGVHAYKRLYFEEVAKLFPPGTYPAEARVDRTFEGSWELPLRGDAQVVLRELAHAGVSTTQTVAYLPGEATLLVGDLVHHGAHAWLEGGIVDGAPAPDLNAWAAALDELAAFPAKTVVRGGRGEAAPLAAAVAGQKAYLQAMGCLVLGYLHELGERREELRGPQAGEHFAEIAGRAAAAFPGRRLSYLVEYGVYGLALSML